MKKYIIPSTSYIAFHTGSICDVLVGSVQTNVGIEITDIDSDPI